MNKNSAGVVISFPFEEGCLVSYENMHAIVLNNDEYMIDNSPFYVYGISFGDTVSVVNDKVGKLIFDSVLERGGHSTYRVKLPINKDHRYFLEMWPKLEKLGCTFEGTSADKCRLYAIDVPPGADVNRIYNILQDAEDNGFWEFEEGHYCPPESARRVQ